MAFKHITSRDNPVFKSLKKIADNNKYRRTINQTLLDGVHLIETYVASFGEPMRVIIPEGRSSAEASGLLQQFDDDLVMMLPTLMFQELAPVASATGILALVEIPQVSVPETVEFALMIEDIQDPGNLGSILRTAAAAGVQAVYLSTPCTHVWSPKCLRGGQGAQFVLPMIERADLKMELTDFNAAGGMSYATALSGDAIYAQDLTQATAVVIGNEGSGLKRDTINAATKAVTIPMAANSAAGVESLNAAAATAIVLFERQRQVLAQG